MKSGARIAGNVAAMVCGLLMAAHFMRAGAYPLVVLGLAFPWLLLAGKLWAFRLVQVILILAAAEWLHTLLVIAMKRLEAGQPWIRMAFILGSVSLLNVVTAIMVRGKASCGETQTRSSV